MNGVVLLRANCLIFALLMYDSQVLLLRITVVFICNVTSSYPPKAFLFGADHACVQLFIHLCVIMY